MTDDLEVIRQELKGAVAPPELRQMCKDLLRLLDEATSDLKNAAPYRANWSKTEKAFRKRIAELEAKLIVEVEYKESYRSEYTRLAHEKHDMKEEIDRLQQQLFKYITGGEEKI